MVVRSLLEIRSWGRKNCSCDRASVVLSLVNSQLGLGAHASATTALYLSSRLSSLPQSNRKLLRISLHEPLNRIANSRYHGIRDEMTCNMSKPPSSVRRKSITVSYPLYTSIVSFRDTSPQASSQEGHQLLPLVNVLHLLITGFFCEWSLKSNGMRILHWEM